MKAGIWEEDITPWVGTERPGGYGKVYNNQVHDPIKIRASVLSDGKKEVVFLSLDLLVVPGKIVTAIREKIHCQLGIPQEAILVAASHTHSSGPVFGLYPEEYQKAPASIKELIEKYSIIPDPVYTTLVIEKAVSAVHRCQHSKQDACLSFWKGQESSCIFNRRFKMKNGQTYTHPGKRNPDILQPAGPVDPEVNVLGVWSGKEEFLGCIVNYACHGTTGPGGISADWIFYLEKTIRGVMGEKSYVVFLNGACGDVTQVDNLSKSELEIGEKYSCRLGQRVGAEVLKGLACPPKGKGTIDFRNKVLKIPCRKVSPERVRSAWKVIEKQKPHSSAEWTFAKELIIADYIVREKPSVEVEIQAIKVGPAIFITNPAELFCSLGLRIKNSSPFPFTFVVELANGCIGYVPDKSAFEPSGGGYETILTSYSHLIPEAGELILKESTSLLQGFQPDKIPGYPKARNFLTPWSYGTRKPELE